MTIWLKQSTAVDVVVGPFVDSTDGATVKTALTIAQASCQLSKNAGAFAQKNSATSATHLTGGMYKVPFSTTDTNTLGTMTLSIQMSGALPVWMNYMIVPANVWDSMFGADLLDVSLVQVGGSAVSTTSAQLGVNVVNAGGTAWGSGAITSGAFATGAITAGAIATDAITSAELSADAVDEILDEVVEGTVTLRQAMRILLAAAANKSSGGGTTSITFRDLADTKARISATVDSNGNRTAVTVDGS